jgi:GNAT superfamily N-acetyltransferase
MGVSQAGMRADGTTRWRVRVGATALYYDDELAAGLSADDEYSRIGRGRPNADLISQWPLSSKPSAPAPTASTRAAPIGKLYWDPVMCASGRDSIQFDGYLSILLGKIEGQEEVRTAEISLVDAMVNRAVPEYPGWVNQTSWEPVPWVAQASGPQFKNFGPLLADVAAKLWSAVEANKKQGAGSPQLKEAAFADFKTAVEAWRSAQAGRLRRASDNASLEVALDEVVASEKTDIKLVRLDSAARRRAVFYDDQAKEALPKAEWIEGAEGRDVEVLALVSGTHVLAATAVRLHGVPTRAGRCPSPDKPVVPGAEVTAAIESTVVVELIALFTCSQVRGHGLGRRLVDVCSAIGDLVRVRRGFGRACVATNATVAADGFYERIGFSPTGSRRLSAADSWVYFHPELKATLKERFRLRWGAPLTSPKRTQASVTRGKSAGARSASANLKRAVEDALRADAAGAFPALVAEE